MTDASPSSPEPRRSLLRRAGRAYGRFVRMLTTLVVGTVLLALGVVFINYVVLSTAKTRAYRNLDPSVAAWVILTVLVLVGSVWLA